MATALSSKIAVVRLFDLATGVACLVTEKKKTGSQKLVNSFKSRVTAPDRGHWHAGEERGSRTPESFWNLANEPFLGKPRKQLDARAASLISTYGVKSFAVSLDQIAKDHRQQPSATLLKRNTSRELATRELATRELAATEDRLGLTRRGIKRL